MKTFSAFKLNLNGTLSNRENLGRYELDSWMISVYGKFATIKVICDQNEKSVVYTDNGSTWERV